MEFVMLPNLTGKSVVVTGGSRGVGLSLVQLAQKAGAMTVSYTYRTRRTVPADQAPDMGNAKPIYFELGSQEGTDRFLEEAKAHAGGGIDLFISNAASQFTGSLGKLTFEEIENVVVPNGVGNIYLARQLLVGGYMAQGGQLAFVGSVASEGNQAQEAYSFTKAGLVALTNSLNRSAEVVERGVGVKCIELVFVDGTDMSNTMLKILRRKIIPGIGGPALVEQFEGSGYVMTQEHAARGILSYAADPLVIGTRRIPEGARLAEMRATYMGEKS